MPSSAAPETRIQRFRQRMQRQGFRQINLWVPDTRAPAFARECRKQSRLAARSGNEVLRGVEQGIDGWT